MARRRWKQQPGRKRAPYERGRGIWQPRGSHERAKYEAPAVEAWYARKQVTAALALLQQLIVIVGVPVGVYTYSVSKTKEREAAERATYEKLDDRYWTYESLALRHVGLDVSDAGVSDPALERLLFPRNSLSAEQRIVERQLMLMLIAMYERAFIMYADQSTEFRAEQWAGWDNGLKRWCRRMSFTEAWQHIGEDFDTKFQVHVNELIKSGCK
jgi:hypothetical protein